MLNYIKILFFSTISCLLCRRLLYSLKKKKLRLSAGKPDRLFFSPSKRVCLRNLKQQKQKCLQQAARVKVKIQNLQSHLFEIKQKMNTISNTSFST